MCGGAGCGGAGCGGAGCGGAGCGVEGFVGAWCRVEGFVGAECSVGGFVGVACGGAVWERRGCRQDHYEVNCRRETGGFRQEKGGLRTPGGGRKGETTREISSAITGKRNVIHVIGSKVKQPEPFQKRRALP